MNIASGLVDRSKVPYVADYARQVVYRPLTRISGRTTLVETLHPQCIQLFQEFERRFGRHRSITVNLFRPNPKMVSVIDTFSPFCRHQSPVWTTRWLFLRELWNLGKPYCDNCRNCSIFIISSYLGPWNRNTPDGIWSQQPKIYHVGASSYIRLVSKNKIFQLYK